jgi:hypothetical protein
MADPGSVNVRQELHDVCNSIFADEERTITHDYLKHKWALKKARSNTPLEGPLLELVVETKTKQRHVFGPIVKVRVNVPESKKPAKTKKWYYKFLVISEKLFAIILVLEESFSLAVLTNYPSDPIAEDLKSAGTVRSGKKVMLDGRWLTAKLESMEVVLLEKVQGLCQELYKEPEPIKRFKLSLKGIGGTSAEKSKGKGVAQEPEQPVPVPTHREQSPPWSEQLNLPPRRGEGSTHCRSEPSFLPSQREEASSPAQSVGRRSAATSLVERETVRVQL